MINTLLPSAIRRVAIVGLSKNVGKTTTLNWLIKEAYTEGHRVGLVSIGVDGESHDVWDAHLKPAISIQQGMWVATARQALQESSARFRLVEELQASSPLGPVYLAECLQQGQVKLAGTYRMADVRTALERMEQHAVTLSLIDGAYDRFASAHHDIAQGVIVCTGAAADPKLESCVAYTEQCLSKWKLPVWEQELPFTKEKVALRKESRWHTLSYTSMLRGLEQIKAEIDEQLEALYLPGALSEWIFQHFASTKQPFTWLVQDPTKLFIPYSAMKRWYRLGGDIQVLHRSTLLALAVSPFTPQGEQQADKWLHGMKAVVGDLPVLDSLRQQVIM